MRESVANSVREVANISPDYVVHNAIDTQYFTPLTSPQSRHKLQLPMNKTLVGCAARIEDGKGHEPMLRSLINLPESVEMVFAGDGSQLNRYREYAEKNWCCFSCTLAWLCERDAAILFGH